jgi:hypothetical protein
LAIGGMIGNLNDFIVKRFSIPYVDVGKLLLVPYFLGAFFSLLIGNLFIKHPQYRRFSYFITSLFYFIGTIIMFYLPNNLEESDVTVFYYLAILIFLIALSMSFAVLYTALCSAIVYIVD